MSRNLVSSLNRMAREIERSQRAASRSLASKQRELERARRSLEREAIAERKEALRQYVEDRIADVQDDNEALDERIQELHGVLRAGLDEASFPTFDALIKEPIEPALSLDHIPPELSEPQLAQFEPAKPSAVVGWIPFVKKRHERRMADARQRFAEARKRCLASNQERLSFIEKARSDHALAVETVHRDVAEHNDSIRNGQQFLSEGNPEFCSQHYAFVLSTQIYPEGFELKYKTSYSKDSLQLMVEVDLPSMEAIIPTVKAFKYVKSSDTVTETPRAEKERKSLYAQVVAQIVLRSLSRLFTADYLTLVDTIVLNGMIEAINPGTGRIARTCVVSVRTTRDTFETVDLVLADPIAVLQTFKASFSKNPAEMSPVRPILEFSMIDPRFIQEGQVLAELDQRTNLMDLSPSEFESLITNLFTKMGLETRQTQASRDGGVDCVAYDPRPIFGGKVVIQAKRYKDTVGVSAVRDLFGTMQNEGASKGILVTTSGYGKAAFDFAAGKPLELLGGANLLALLLDHAGLDARIVMPEQR